MACPSACIQHAHIRNRMQLRLAQAGYTRAWSVSHTPTRPHFRPSLGKGALWAGSVSHRFLAQPNVSDSIMCFVKRNKTYLWLLRIHKSSIPWTLERAPTALPASPTNDQHPQVPFPVLFAPHLPRRWRRLTGPALGSEASVLASCWGGARSRARRRRPPLRGEDWDS